MNLIRGFGVMLWTVSMIVFIVTGATTFEKIILAGLLLILLNISEVSTILSRPMEVFWKPKKEDERS